MLVLPAICLQARYFLGCASCQCVLHAGQGERYWLRMLLTTVQGATGYEDLRTVDGHEYGSFKEAAIALGLATDDDEQDKMLEAASLACFPGQMRQLFAEMLVWHEPLEVGKLWDKWVEQMAEDFLRKERQVSQRKPTFACTSCLTSPPTQ